MLTVDTNDRITAQDALKLVKLMLGFEEQKEEEKKHFEQDIQRITS
jgi:hypothetical protein